MGYDYLSEPVSLPNSFIYYPDGEDLDSREEALRIRFKELLDSGWEFLSVTVRHINLSDVKDEVGYYFHFRKAVS